MRIPLIPRLFVMAIPAVTGAWALYAPVRGEASQMLLPEGDVVGPSVLMNRRREGKVQIVDLRRGGRQVPLAQLAAQWRGAEPEADLFLLGDPEKCRQWANGRGLKYYQIVPSHMMEVHPLRGAPEVSPGRAQTLVKQKNWPLFDISEDVEFEQLRLPGSQRLDYARFQQGSRSQLDKSRPVLVACRVGHRAQYVVRQLRLEGYQAYNVSGGLWQWECDGLPLEVKSP